jgi:hypothetical protein
VIASIVFAMSSFRTFWIRLFGSNSASASSFPVYGIELPYSRTIRLFFVIVNLLFGIGTPSTSPVCDAAVAMFEILSKSIVSPWCFPMPGSCRAN